ncbi:MAG: DNA repair protein RecO [Bacteroidales bacterium]|jgi:DNA repair protein RecO (recombination protein O)|nr:DNA repair protein RecO [Bacteroidales bacterium]
MLIATRGIVLHKIKYGEQGLIVSMFTREIGSQSFIVKNAFSKKNKINYTRLGNLALLDIRFNYTGSDLAFLKEIHLLHPFTRLHIDPVRQSLLLFYNELLYKTLFHYGEDTVLYDFVENSIKDLDCLPVISPDIHLRFMVRLSCYMGFMPKNNYTVKDSHFFLREGIFQPYYYDTGEFLSALASKYLHALAHGDMPAPVPSKAIREELLQGLLTYFILHHEGIHKIVSADILTKIWHEHP